MVLFNVLSCVYPYRPTEIKECDLAISVNSTIDYLTIIGAHLNQLQLETASDTVLRRLTLAVTLQGWRKKVKIPPAGKPYYNLRGEITYNEGLLMKRQRIIVATTLRSTMKQIVHGGTTSPNHPYVGLV